ncbi:hypothetical protein Tco_0611030 [Tanacetum coccineum]
MTTLNFADTHNLVAFLSKPAESEGFEQIVDFLNANPIKYALTINPTIYTSCIEKFWATVKAKTVNGEVQLQALVDGKKIIITESIVRRDLQLEDAEGVDCLPNATIFEQLTLMGYEKLSQKLTFYKAFFSPQWKFLIHTILQCLSAKTTAWNEFSSTIASAIILLLDRQLERMATHDEIYIAPSHTKKIFGNMRRVEKGFSGRDTPLFQTMIAQAQAEIGEGSVIPTDLYHTPTIIQPLSSQPQKKQQPRRSKKKDTQIPQSSVLSDSVADEAVNEEIDDSLERAATTATSLDAEQDRSNITKTQSKATPNEPSSLRTSSGGGPKRQETMGDIIAQTRSENVSKLSNNPLLASGEEDASKQGRKINDIDIDEDITLVNDQDDTDMFSVNDLDGDEVVVVEQEVAAKDLTIDKVTLAQALAALKSAKPKVKANVVEEPSLPVSIASTKAKVQDKGKGIMVEPKKPLKKKDQISFDEETAKRLQAEFDEEERLAREKEEVNAALTEEWDGIQAKIEVDHLLAERLQVREQEELTIEERAKLFQQLLEKRRKHFAAKRA